MEIDEVMRTALTCRAFRPDPVDDEVIMRALDLARFAPAGGNRQPVRYIIVREQVTRAALKALYFDSFRRIAETATGHGTSGPGDDAPENGSRAR